MTISRGASCLVLGALALAAGPAHAQGEAEPNDDKTQANAFVLPAVDTPGVITGNSTSGAGAGLDYFRVRTPTRAAAGFFRHRLIARSATPGHVVSVRGLTQTGGVINPGTDPTVQTSSLSTTPPSFVQWYTSRSTAELFVRVAGTSTTTADYALDYEVAPVTEMLGPENLPAGPLTITTVGQTLVDTDLWVHDAFRDAIPGFGNDDEPDPGNTTQSTLTRTYLPGTYYLALTNYNLANHRASPAEDNWGDGNVFDFPRPIANSSTTASLDLDSLIGGVAVAAIKPGPFDVLFIRFTVAGEADLLFRDGLE
jgi:hypothetical protein